MTINKKFDCVALKNAIQAKLIKANRGKSEEEIRKNVSRRIKTSTSPVARLWRAVQKQHRQKKAS